jgi:hypothetical protein
VEFDSATGDYSQPDSNTVIWDIGRLGPYESNYVTLTVKVGCAEPNSTITNCCEMTGDCINSPITACEYTAVGGPPTLTKVDDVNGCVGPGDYITYHLCYSANGFRDTSVVIIDELPPELEFISASGDYSRPDSKTVIWDIWSLGPDDSNCVTLTVKVKCAEPNSIITNQCKMTSTCLTSPIFAEESTPTCPNFPTFSKVDDVNDCDYAWTNDYLTYSLCYAAKGYGDANVVITDNLPPEVNFVSASGDYNQPDPNTVIWYLGTLSPGDSDCLTLKVKVKPFVESDTIITNRSWLMGDSFDLYSEENTPVCRYHGFYVDEVMADDPCLYLRFEDYQFVDSSGNDYWVDGTANIEKTPGSMGDAAYLFSKSYVAAANQQTEPNLPVDYNDAYAFAPNDISFELWFKADTDVEYLAAFFNQAETGYDCPFPWCVYQNRAPAAGRYETQMRAMTYARPGESFGECWRYTEPNVSVWPTDGKWHHLVVTYDEDFDGDGNTDELNDLRVRMYLDTILVIDDANSGGGTVGPEMDHILIGNLRSRDLPGLNPYKGYIDEFAIYPGVLSQCRVAAHYAAWWAKDCNELWDRELVGMQPGIDPILAAIDHNHDCRIDFYDFAVLAENWMLCNDPEGGEGCVPNW